MMDFFATFKKNMEESVSKARDLVHNVSERAQDLAQLAASQAKVVAETAKGLSETSTWDEASSKAKEALLDLPNKIHSQNKHQLEAFGLNSNFKDFVRSLDYGTFRDYNEQEMDRNVGFIEDPDGNIRLNDWQVEHAKLALSEFEELNHLRYLLCPKRMSEEKFWLVYFSLAQSHLPHGCRTGQLPEIKITSPTPTPEPMELTKLDPKEEEKMEDVAERERSEDDLDSYLDRVLQEPTEETTSEGEGFEDFEDYMDQLNAEMNAEQKETPTSEIEVCEDESTEENTK